MGSESHNSLKAAVPGTKPVRYAVCLCKPGAIILLYPFPERPCRPIPYSALPERMLPDAREF